MDGTGIAIRNFAIRSNLTSTDSDEKLVGEGGGGMDRNRERTALFATKAAVYSRPRKDSG